MSAYPQLAVGEVQTPPALKQPFVGDRPISNDSAVMATAACVQYQVLALLSDGTVVPFVNGTNTPSQAVISAIGGNVGARVPYYDAGHFNHEALVWPAGLAATLNARKAFFNGTPIKVGHVLPN